MANQNFRVKNGLEVGTGVTISGGIITATSFTGSFSGNATGLSGTPNITVGFITASGASISGNISVAGTVTYEDVTNVDSIGVITARSGIVVSSGSSIGIGTANPRATFEISGGAGIATVRLTNIQFKTNKKAGAIDFRVGGSAAELSNPVALIEGWDDYDGGDYQGSLRFYTLDNDIISERLRITPSGNIGIGTTNPSDKLHVFGGNTRIDSASGALTFWSGAGFFGGIGVANAFGGTGNNMLVRADTGRSIIFQSGGANERVRIFDTGEVGIGTTVLTGTASQRLQVTGSAYVSGSVGIGTTDPTAALTIATVGSATTGASQIYLNGGTSNRIDFNQNGVAPPALATRSAGTKIVLYPILTGATVDYAMGIESGHIWQSVASTSSAQGFKWYGGTTELARLRGDGNLGIGTTNPTDKLHVVGNINSTTDITINGTSVLTTASADAVALAIALG